MGPWHTWEPVGDPQEATQKQKLVFRLHGETLADFGVLVRSPRHDDKQDQWMFLEKCDEWARPTDEYHGIVVLPDGVVEKPLGLIEERGPPGSRPGPTVTDAESAEPDLAG